MLKVPLVLIAILTLALIASSGDRAHAGPQTQTPDPVFSDIVGFALEDLVIPLGTTVTWTNQHFFRHTSTSGVSPDPDGIWDTGFLLPDDVADPILFDQVGVFDYFCRVHPSIMQATVTVPAPMADAIRVGDLTVEQGSNGILPVFVEGQEPPGPSAFDFEFTYDPSVINITGGETPLPGWLIVFDSSPGQFHIIGFTVSDQPSGDFLFLDLDVETVGQPGDSTVVDLSVVDYGGSNNSIPIANIFAGSVTISEPHGADAIRIGDLTMEPGPNGILPVFVEGQESPGPNSFDFEFTYDPSVINIIGAETPFPDWAIFSNSSLGQFKVRGLSLLDGPTADFLFLNLDVEPVGLPGDSTVVDLTVVSYRGGGNPIPVANIFAGSVTISEPTVADAIRVGALAMEPDSTDILPVFVEGQVQGGPSAFDFEIFYDPSVINITGADTPSPDWNIIFIDVAPGFVEVAGFLPYAGPTGDFVLLHLDVESVGQPGDATAIELTVLYYGDIDLNPIPVEDVFAGSVTIIQPTGADAIRVGDLAVEPGQSGILPVFVEGQNPPGPAIIDFEFTYDPSVMNITGAEFPFPGWTFVFTASPGLLRAVGFGFSEHPTGDSILLNLNVEPVGQPGDFTAVNLTVNEYRDSDIKDIPIGDVFPGNVTIKAPTPIVCTLNLDLSHTVEGINLNFHVGTIVPAIWEVWAVVRGDIIPVLSMELPRVEPPINRSFTMPISNIGVIGFLTTLYDEELFCSDWETVDTGRPAGPAVSGQELGELFEVMNE